MKSYARFIFTSLTLLVLMSTIIGNLEILSKSSGAFGAPINSLEYIAASSPFRICDTRPNNQTPCHGQTLSAKSTYNVQVVGVNVGGQSVPTNAQAVVINVTATNTQAAGYFSVYPAGAKVPPVSSVNWSVAGQTVANLVQVGLSNGQIDVYLGSNAPADLIVDVQGWYVPIGGGGLLYNPITPFRVCDTRTGTSTQCSGQLLSNGTSLTFKVAGLGSVPSGTTSVILNVTIIAPTAPGYISVYPTGSSVPLISNQNFGPNATIAIRVFATLSTSNPGYESVYIFGANANIAVDVDGYFGSSTGEAFYLANPQRIIDTRCYYTFDEPACQNEELPASNLNVSLTKPNQAQYVQVVGVDDIPSWATAVAINATAVSWDSTGYLTIYPPSSSVPLASDLNFQAPGQVSANADIVGIGSFSETINSKSLSGLGFEFISNKQMQLIADVIGYYGPLAPVSQLYVAPMIAPNMIPNTSYSINLEASDATGATLTWSITQSGSNFSICSTQGSICTLTGQEPAGSYSITVTVSDGTTSSTLNLTLVSASPAFSSPMVIATAPVVMVSVSCVNSSFCVAGGALTSTFNGTSWSNPVSVDPQAGFNSVSCVSSSFCIAVDTSGQALSYNGTSWSSPTVIDSNPGYYGVMSVSCVSSSFCMAVDDNGQAIYYGSSWRSPSMIDPAGNGLGRPLYGVSCSSLYFCATIDSSGNVLLFNGFTWSSPSYVDSYLSSISCPANGFCVLTDAAGRVIYYQNGTFSQPITVDSGVDLASVSCSSTNFCMAIDLLGRAVIFSNGTWSSVYQLTNDKYELRAVSCGQNNFCVAVAHTIVTYSGGSFSSPFVIPGSQSTFVNVSCPQIYWCMAASTSGEAIELVGNIWSVPQQLETNVNGFLGISCSSSVFCLAVDNAGYGFIFDGGGWYIEGIEPGVSLVSVSCFSSYNCLVADQKGNVIRMQNGIWQNPIHIDVAGAFINSVSCVSSGFCVAVDDSGNAFTYNGGSWSSADHIDSSPGAAGITSVSCYSTSFCMAVDFAGHAISYNGSSWSSPVSIAPSFVGFASVSCPEQNYCWASDWIGSVIQLTNGTWQNLVTIDSSYGVVSVSCPFISYCVASSDNSSAMITPNSF